MHLKKLLEVIYLVEFILFVFIGCFGIIYWSKGWSKKMFYTTLILHIFVFAIFYFFNQENELATIGMMIYSICVYQYIGIYKMVNINFNKTSSFKQNRFL